MNLRWPIIRWPRGTNARPSQQWRGESEAAGEATRLMAPPPPPPSHTFYCFLVWDACHVVSTTCNDRRSLRNTFGWMRALQAPQQFHGRVLVEVQGALPWKLQRICIFQYCPTIRGWLSFFHVHCSTKSQEIPKVQNFQFSSFL